MWVVRQKANNSVLFRYVPVRHLGASVLLLFFGVVASSVLGTGVLTDENSHVAGGLLVFSLFFLLSITYAKMYGAVESIKAVPSEMELVLRRTTVFGSTVHKVNARHVTGVSIETMSPTEYSSVYKYRMFCEMTGPNGETIRVPFTQDFTEGLQEKKKCAFGDQDRDETTCPSVPWNPGG
eukprot:Rmarinus@m.2613